jgi:hypothetical protein
MKKSLLFSLAAVCLLTSASQAFAQANAQRFNPKAVSPRYFKTDSKVKLTIAAQGKALCLL